MHVDRRRELVTIIYDIHACKQACCTCDSTHLYDETPAVRENRTIISIRLRASCTYRAPTEASGTRKAFTGFASLTVGYDWRRRDPTRHRAPRSRLPAGDPQEGRVSERSGGVSPAACAPAAAPQRFPRRPPFGTRLRGHRTAVRRVGRKRSVERETGSVGAIARCLAELRSTSVSPTSRASKRESKASEIASHSRFPPRRPLEMFEATGSGSFFLVSACSKLALLSRFGSQGVYMLLFLHIWGSL